MPKDKAIDTQIRQQDFFLVTGSLIIIRDKIYLVKVQSTGAEPRAHFLPLLCDQLCSEGFLAATLEVSRPQHRQHKATTLHSNSVQVHPG